jgi:peptide-methionine (S)-S-oxide reductase
MALVAYSQSGGGHAAERAVELPKPAVDLQADQNPKAGETHEAVFAGGCFWCMDGIFRQLKGVKDVTSGYAGGSKQTAEYETVCTGTTGHAESIRIHYDPSQITYGELLRVFFTVHDPTTLNRQGPDSGTQYRSAVFYLDDDQKKVAEAYIQQLDKTGIFPTPIVTKLEALKPDAFYPAEDYHQNYVACHLGNPYVRYHALPMVQKAREQFKDEVKPATTQP